METGRVMTLLWLCLWDGRVSRAHHSWLTWSQRIEQDGRWPAATHGQPRGHASSSYSVLLPRAHGQGQRGGGAAQTHSERPPQMQPWDRPTPTSASSWNCGLAQTEGVRGTTLPPAAVQRPLSPAAGAQHEPWGLPRS